MKKVMYACILSGIASGFSPAAMSAATVDGAAVFARNCSVCHPLNPPPKSAPPVMALANRYHEKFATKQQGVAHMAAFLKKPDKTGQSIPRRYRVSGLCLPYRLPMLN